MPPGSLIARSNAEAIPLMIRMRISAPRSQTFSTCSDRNLSISSFFSWLLIPISARAFKSKPLPFFFLRAFLALCLWRRNSSSSISSSSSSLFFIPDSASTRKISNSTCSRQTDRNVDHSCAVHSQAVSSSRKRSHVLGIWEKKSSSRKHLAKFLRAFTVCFSLGYLANMKVVDFSTESWFPT